jgi:hypothetical protein
MPTQNITNGWSATVVAANTSTTIQFINIPPSINNVLLILSNTFSSTTNYNPIIQFSSNNGSSYISTGYESGIWYYGTSNASSTYSTGVLLIPTAITNQVVQGYIYIIGLNTVGGSPGGYGTCSRVDNYGISFAGSLASTNANAFQIANVGPTGNITGTFKAYGLS